MAGLDLPPTASTQPFITCYSFSMTFEQKIQVSHPSYSDNPIPPTVHFGVNSGATKFYIEHQAINEATFRCPDEMGWKPQKVPIVPADGGVSRVRKIQLLNMEMGKAFLSYFLVGGNITRLENKYTSNTTKYNHLYIMIQEEVDAKTAKGSSSCTNGLLWLTRAMDFLVELFRNLLEHQDWAMSQACTDSYTKTLKKWHGWLASSSFTIAMKISPDRKKLLDVVGGSGDINGDIEKFCTIFSPLLEENHNFLASIGMDDLKAS